MKKEIIISKKETNELIADFIAEVSDDKVIVHNDYNIITRDIQQLEDTLAKTELFTSDNSLHEEKL